MPRAERRLGYPIREGRKGDRRLRAAMTMMNAIVNIHRGESSVPFVFLRVCQRSDDGRAGGERRRSRWPGQNLLRLSGLLDVRSMYVVGTDVPRC